MTATLMIAVTAGRRCSPAGGDAQPRRQVTDQDVHPNEENGFMAVGDASVMETLAETNAASLAGPNWTRVR